MNSTTEKVKQLFDKANIFGSPLKVVNGNR
jgi:hypothetical protein